MHAMQKSLAIEYFRDVHLAIRRTLDNDVVYQTTRSANTSLSGEDLFHNKEDNKYIL